MTRDRDFKRLVRTRMRKTGEAYAQARARLVGAVTAPLRTGGEGMYPFERFTERAKRVLTLAQEEAERKGHSYIGTEHLLLGLLRERDGLAAIVLTNLGIEIGQVRQTIDSVLGRTERLIVKQIIPTSRVKKVIEIAFEEAQRMGNNFVGTEHLLIGILAEGEGVGAHVLNDLGATIDRVRAEVERLLKEVAGGASITQLHQRRGLEAGPRSFGPLPGQATQTALGLARDLAKAQGAASVDPEHLLRVLQDPAARKLMEQSAETAALQGQMEKAAGQADFHEAARLKDELMKLQAAYERARTAWQKKLGRGKKPKPDSG